LIVAAKIQQQRTAMSKIEKVVLAYSGGLDTSVIVRWLQDTYGCEVVTFTADIGQGEEVEPARAKAEALGVKEIYIDDLREEYVRDFVFPMFRANAIYEGEYLLGTSIARPLIAKRLIEIANETGADAISHGATGKGNDQVRFELGAYALKPGIQVIAPWREWDLNSREKLMQYCEQHKIPVDFSSTKKKSPYSMDANLLHISYEGGILEDPWAEAEEDMWRWSVSPEAAPEEPTYITIGFEKGDPVSIDGERLSPATLLEKLNKLGGANGIGRLDIVENRYVGMKSRGCYETPGGTILMKAHRAIESITLDREVAHMKDSLMPRYADLVYNGYWWSPERRMLQAAIDESQEVVNGEVRLKLYKGSVSAVGRRSVDSLFDERIATFEDDAGAYNQKDAEGFIKLNALRLRIAAGKGRKLI
jgi:argininosuccinate synthase